MEHRVGEGGEGQYKRKAGSKLSRRSFTFSRNLFRSHFLVSPERLRPWASRPGHTAGCPLMVLSVLNAGTSGAGDQFFNLCCFLLKPILFFPALHPPPCSALTGHSELIAAPQHWLVLVVHESGSSESSRSLGGHLCQVSCCSFDPLSGIHTASESSE